MTDPLLWLDGDPTDGRRARPHEPAPEARTEPLPRPAPEPPRRTGLFRAALAGGLVSAVLVGGGAFALGVVDDSSSTAAPATGPALVGAKQTGDIAAIYAAARNSVVSIKTSDGSGHRLRGQRQRHDHHQRARGRDRVDGAGAVRRRRDRAGDGRRRRSLLGPRGREGLDVAHAQAAGAGGLRDGEDRPAGGRHRRRRSGSRRRPPRGSSPGTGRHIQAPDGFQIDSVIQTDAPINPGNSGGPLLDATGRVIGVNSQIASQSGGSVGIGFAVPSNTVRDVIPRLEKGETIKRAYLGVSTSADSGKRDRRRGDRGWAGGDRGRAGRRRDHVRRRQERQHAG